MKESIWLQMEAGQSEVGWHHAVLTVALMYTRPAVTHRVGWGVHDFLAGQQFQQFPARKRQLAGVWPYQHNQYTRVLECWNVDRSCAGM